MMEESQQEQRRLWLSLKFWLSLLFTIIVILLIYYIYVDRFAPNTSDASVQAYTIQLSPQVPGRVEQIYVKNNVPVKKGQLLFRIEQQPYQYVIDKLKSELVKAEYYVKQLKAEAAFSREVIQQRQANLTFFRTKANAFKKLVREGAISVITFDQVVDRYLQNQALVNQSKSNLQKALLSLEAKIDGENVVIKTVRAKLKLAEYNLSQTMVYAPSDGYVTNILVAPGVYASAGTAVLAFVNTEKWWVVANIKENNMGRIRIGQPSVVSLPMYPNRFMPGKVISIGWGVNLEKEVPNIYTPYIQKTTNWINLSQRFPVLIEVHSHNHQAYPLRVGATARVVIRTTGKLSPAYLFARIIQNIASFLDYVW